MVEGCRRSERKKTFQRHLYRNLIIGANTMEAEKLVEWAKIMIGGRVGQRVNKI